MEDSGKHAAKLCGRYRGDPLFGFVPIAIMGKADAFEKGLNPIALYGLVVPMAVLASSRSKDKGQFR
jgi:hypothetical protein